ncbi:MAG: alkaline phosphatase [Acidobacteria bacterium]|nr:alkaline phosphatase [Acidobacteriota bacterium]
MILFLGDAGGIPTLNAASIHGYREPRALYIQHMPHIALSETSSTNSWVTDSAAGMTAIVTGRKTDNGVLSEEAPAGGQAGAPLKTILEYAEEHGLSTGVISNMPMTDATPAACYAHVDSRKKSGEIFEQVWKPRFGDGVDLVIGNGRKAIMEATKQMGIDVEKELRASGRSFYDSLDAIPAGAGRVVALFDDKNFDVDAATAKAIRILSRNPKGYFLMVEWDLHPTRPEQCLDTAVKLDRLIQRTAKENQNALVLFTADHSFDFRVLKGKKGSDLKLPQGPNVGEPLPEKSADRPDVMIGTSHTGEEVLVAAQGPGSERVQGVLANTDLFAIMLAAYGWEITDARPQTTR